MHATVDRQICEHDVGHVFVSPHSSRQRGIHTSRVRRVYLSVRSRPHFMSRSRDYMNTSNEILFESVCEIVPDGTFQGTKSRGISPITRSG